MHSEFSQLKYPV